MNFELLENKTKGQIESFSTNLIPTLSVELEPEIEDENQPIKLNPKVTIYVDKISSKGSKTAQHIAQDVDLNIFLLVRARKLRGDLGIYTICDLLRKSLIGFRPEGYEKFYFVRMEYEKRERGIWWYTFVIGTQTMFTEEFEDQKAPLLKEPKTDFKDNDY